jgi:hypothetical protein
MQTDNEHSKWAWDTSPTDGGPPRPVYIGNKEQWSIEETRKRRDTNRNPWGGVWTDPLTTGATKAKWGKRTFDSGRYRCCHDMHDCGLFVSVKQGVVNAWHFQRQWSWGRPRTYQHICKNEAMYAGTSRFHHIVVNEIFSMLSLSKEFDGKAIESITKERSVAHLGNFEPDVYVKFEDDTWFAIEVILTSAPDRDKHDMFGMNLIEINLDDLDCLDNDRDFSRWMQQGGVSELLLAESTLEQRTQRWKARENKWKRKDEREFRKAFDNRMGVCASRFGFDMDIQCDSITELDQIDRLFTEEKARRLRLIRNPRHKQLGASMKRHSKRRASTTATSNQTGARDRDNVRSKAQSSSNTRRRSVRVRMKHLRAWRQNREQAIDDAQTGQQLRDAQRDFAHFMSQHGHRFRTRTAGKISSRSGTRQNR